MSLCCCFDYVVVHDASGHCSFGHCSFGHCSFGHGGIHYSFDNRKDRIGFVAGWLLIGPLGTWD